MSEPDESITVEPSPQADRRKAAFWVQYQTPVFVRVEPDEDGWGTELGTGFVADH